MHAVDSPPEPLRLFNTRGAGTAKSHVISVVHQDFGHVTDVLVC